MANKYFDKTIVKQKQWNTNDGNVKRKAFVLTYRATALLIFIIFIISVAITGFVYAKYKQKITIIEATKSMANFTEEALYKTISQHKRLLNKLPSSFSSPAPTQLTPQEFLETYGKTATLHIDMTEYFKTSEFKKCINAANDLLDKEKISDVLKQDAYKKLAWSYFYLKDYDKSLEIIKEALDKNPKFYSLEQLRLDLYIIRGENKNAFEVLDRLENTINSPEFFFSKANLLWQTGKVNEAIDLYQNVLASKNLRVILSAANNLALIFAEDKKDFTRARFYITMMQALAPYGFTTQRTTGKILLMQRQYKMAEVALKRAEKLIPSNVEVLLNLSILYQKTGNTIESETYLHKALKLNKNADKLIMRQRQDLGFK